MNINTENLKEIYLISNTASFLLNGFSKDESIFELRKNYSQASLIEKFTQISNTEIEQLDDLVMAYAIFIAILLFDNEETFDFVNGVGNVNFEWFPELRHIYISRLKSFNVNQVKAAYPIQKLQRGYTNNSLQTNNEVIEFV